MQSRKIMACGESWKSSLYLLARIYFCKVVDFRLILTILIFPFAVSKLATQLLHSLKFLTHLISAIQL